jgi:hypothetical protein
VAAKGSAELPPANPVSNGLAWHLQKYGWKHAFRRDDESAEIAIGLFAQALTDKTRPLADREKTTEEAIDLIGLDVCEEWGDFAEMVVTHRLQCRLEDAKTRITSHAPAP